MNKRSKAIIASTLLIIGTAAAGTALGRGDHGLGHGPRGDYGFGHGPRIERMAERLDLSDEQREAIRAIIDDSRSTLREYRDSLRENRQQLRELVQSDTADEEAIRTLADAQGDIMADTIVQEAQVKRAIRAVLTPEQQAQADALMERRDGPGKRRKRRHTD